jgi:hypothetical protein
MVRTTESNYVHQKTRLLGKKLTSLLKAGPGFCHPRAKLISPTQKTCWSVLALKSAMCIQRDACLAIPERKSNKKKKNTTWAVLCLCSFHHVLQSWINHEIHDWLMIGFCIVMIVRLGLINFARGGTVFATSWF